MRRLVDPVRNLVDELARLSPGPLKRLLNKLANPFSSVDKLHRFYERSSAGSPAAFLSGEARSLLLVELIRRYSNPRSNIIEIGCNVGRNLNYLYHAGFRRLEGVEINKSAVEMLRSSYPDMAAETLIHTGPVEEVITDFAQGEFDVVFTMTVLMHIHPDSEWIFREMVRVTRDLLITIENEHGLSWNHFPRNYRKVFESLGLRQLEEVRCTDIEGLGSDFFARVFRKET